MRYFLTYWRPDTADFNLHGEESMDHIASQQFHRLRPDDEVFVVTVRAGRLSLLGHIVVGRLVDQETAEQLLGQTLWDADFHILCKPGTESPLAEFLIDECVERLRFKSKNDRLSLRDGKVDSQQLRTMRELTPQSADILLAQLRT